MILVQIYPIALLGLMKNFNATRNGEIRPKRRCIALLMPRVQLSPRLVDTQCNLDWKPPMSENLTCASVGRWYARKHWQLPDIRRYWWGISWNTGVMVQVMKKKTYIHTTKEQKCAKIWIPFLFPFRTHNLSTAQLARPKFRAACSKADVIVLKPNSNLKRA